MSHIEKMKTWLKALETAQNNLAPSKSSAHSFGDGELWDFYEDAATSLRQAIAEAEKQEPVAWAMLHDNGDFIDAICPEEHARLEGEYKHPVYTHSQPKAEQINSTTSMSPTSPKALQQEPKRVPLTEDGVREIFASYGQFATGKELAMITAIIHGIKGEA